jgi:hypothetical protein
LFDVVAAGARRYSKLKFGAFLKAKQQREQYAWRRDLLSDSRVV